MIGPPPLTYADGFEDGRHDARVSYDDGYNDGHTQAVKENKEELLRVEEEAYDRGYDAGQEYERELHNWDKLRTAAGALAGTVHEAIQRLTEPVPGHDDTDRVLADIQSALDTYTAEVGD